MRCIFCKQDSSTSGSVEHILPESLGNSNHVLPKGVVCDGCNNYFAKSVEQPFLESEAIRVLRFQEGLVSKRGRIPPLVGAMPPGVPIRLWRDAKTGTMTADVPTEQFERLMVEETAQLFLPTSGKPPPNRVVSRFMAKVAVESMAERLLPQPALLEQFIDDAQIDPIRNHARRGHPLTWVVHVRRIYAANARTPNPDGTWTQVMHEADFLVTPEQEIYHVHAIFGLEFAINIGGPSGDGYLAWLKDNDQASPLYSPGYGGPSAMPRLAGAD